MKGGAAAGFTIVETLIVLAVSMAIFLSATLLINGKQRSTAFNTSIRELQTQLQQVVGTVSSGQFSSDGSFTCVNGVIKTGVSDAQGTSTGCVTIGKVLQFNVGTADPEQYYAYTLYGLQDPDATQALDLVKSKAQVIPLAKAASSVDIANLQYGLTTKSMTANGRDISAVAVAANTSSFGDTDGSQQLNIVPISGSGTVTTHRSDPGTAATINSLLKNPLVANPAAGVQICFASGGTDQSGLITLGAAGQPGVQLKIYQNGNCR